MNTPVVSYRPHAVIPALQALADTDKLLRKASSQLYLRGDVELSDQLRARINANAQALREASET
jgi:hypothetical protein